MRFGPLPLVRAEGAILAHSVNAGGAHWRKGLRLLSADVAALRAAGVGQVMAATLDAGDVEENGAAAALAFALVPDPDGQGISLSVAFTGRVNLNATGPGVVEVEGAAVHALNRVDPAITFATLAPLARVSKGTLLGTVKIIAYAVPGEALARACALAAGAIRLRPVMHRTASLILTEVPGQDPKLGPKGRRAVEGRLRGLGMRLADCATVAHEEAALAAALSQAGGDIVLILTGSATSDLHDTAPLAVARAGGSVARFGMPVDPGNLLFVGSLGLRPVIGLPGCARSSALNGADWVLERLACGLTVGDAEIAAMGVGGLLKEISSRPQQREPEA